MGSGGRRVGAGRPPKALADLRLTGGIRAGRHASLLKAVPLRSALALSPSSPPVPAEIVEGLGQAGAAFVSAVWAEAEGWGVSELALLRLAGRALDDAESAPNVADRHRATRLFGAVVAQLGLEKLGGRS